MRISFSDTVFVESNLKCRLLSLNIGQPYEKKPRLQDPTLSNLSFSLDTSLEDLENLICNEVMEAFWAAPPVSRYVIIMSHAPTGSAFFLARAAALMLMG